MIRLEHHFVCVQVGVIANVCGRNYKDGILVYFVHDRSIELRLLLPPQSYIFKTVVYSIYVTNRYVTLTRCKTGRPIT